MCCKKFHTSKPLAERRPQLTKCWSVDNITPRDAVQIRKHEVSPWRTNVIVGTIDNSIAFDSYHCNGTCTIAAVVSGLKVDSCKRGCVRLHRSALSSHHVLQWRG